MRTIVGFISCTHVGCKHMSVGTVQGYRNMMIVWTLTLHQVSCLAGHEPTMGWADHDRVCVDTQEQL